MLRRLIQPWVLYRFRDGGAEVMLVWRNRLSLFVVLLLLLVELFSPSRVSMTLLLTFASVMAVAAWWAWHMARGVRVRRRGRVAWVQVGDLLEERFTLVNDSPLPALWVEVNDCSDLPGYNVSTVRAVGARGVYRWITSGECRLRGEYHLGPWEATTCDPFGIFAVVQRNPAAETVMVYPPIARRLPFALPRGAAAGRARTSHRSWEPTVSVGGVRTYVPGDPLHHVHWPTTARRDELYAKVFDQETGGDIWLVLDLDRDVQVGQAERSTEEKGIIVAASVAALLLDAGRAVGLIVYGPQRRLVMPARGRGHLWGLLHVLAQVHAADSRPLARVLEELARALPTGATALVITPSCDLAWMSGLVRLQSRGVGATVLLLDAVSFEEGSVDGRISPQAEALRGLLADAGIGAEVIHADTPLSLRPPTGQVRRWEFKVLATGRAVAISRPWGFSPPGGGGLGGGVMIGWLVKRLRPREGWGTFLLLLTTVLCLPAAVMAAEWIPEDEYLLWLVLVALLVGRWLALREGCGWSVWLTVGVSLGLLAALSVAAHVVLFLPGSGEVALDFVRRWMIWLEAAFSGGTSDDPGIFLFYSALLCWGAVLFAAWAFYRCQRPLLALLPLVWLSALTVFYSDEGITWLIGELGCGVTLLAAGNLTRVQRTWEATGVDYAADLGFDLLIVALLVAVAVVLLSSFGPLLSVRGISTWFWQIFEEPADRVQETMERLFGGVTPPIPPSRGGKGGASSYLPQSRLLGGRPDLLNEVVMMVWTDEPPPPPDDLPAALGDLPRHYWRGATWDHYSGRGWATTVDFREEVEGELPLPVPPAYRQVAQRFEFTAPHGDTLYALNAPAWVGRPVEAVWRSPPSVPPNNGGDERPPVPPNGGDERGGDLARLASEVVSYTIVSRLPRPTADDLRAVSMFCPPEIPARYLQLPETVPQRVIDLAQEVVADGETVYERARLLERYLRAYPYSLELEQPPEGWDVADYFLFGAREGYCDYYATTFVVMARAVGIPARLASGYAGGQYDFAGEVYLVRQFNGHSWPEVYFPGWGWIGFEPTGAQPVTELPDEMLLPERALPGPTGPPARMVRFGWRVARLGLALLVGVGLAVVVWGHYSRRRAALVVTLPLVWGWVRRAGARLGLPPDPALTPQEYALALAAELRARAEQARRWRDHWAGLAAQGGAALEVLGVLYSTQIYGGPQVTVVDEGVVRNVWARLRGPLRRFRWLGWGQRLGRRIGGGGEI